MVDSESGGIVSGGILSENTINDIETTNLIIKENKIDKEDDIYAFFQLFFSLKNDYRSKNKKDLDFEAKEKLINLVLGRFTKKDREE